MNEWVSDLHIGWWNAHSIDWKSSSQWIHHTWYRLTRLVYTPVNILLTFIASHKGHNILQQLVVKSPQRINTWFLQCLTENKLTTCCGFPDNTLWTSHNVLWKKSQHIAAICKWLLWLVIDFVLWSMWFWFNTKFQHHISTINKAFHDGLS